MVSWCLSLETDYVFLEIRKIFRIEIGSRMNERKGGKTEIVEPIAEKALLFFIKTNQYPILF